MLSDKLKILKITAIKLFLNILKFDSVDLSKKGYRVSRKVIDDAVKRVQKLLKNVIKFSYSNILVYHKVQTFSN
jgi:histidinol dehydrogenase